jgi:hypothetical protein
MVLSINQKMLDLYCIPGTSNICKRELEGLEYNTEATWPTFQEDWITLKKNITEDVSRNNGKLYLRIFDGEFWFLQGQKVGNVGTRHCSKSLTSEFLKPFYDGFLCADIVSTQLYENEMLKYKKLFPQRPFDIPMELIYSLISSRWIFQQFPDCIALIGGNGKMKIIKELMKYHTYRNYLGITDFCDYISVPERLACDNTEEIFLSIRDKIAASRAKIFLFGIGISKLAIAHKFKTLRSDAQFIDVGCGISALAGTTSIERPYFGSWINHRLHCWDYSDVDPIDFRDTEHLNVVYLD